MHKEELDILNVVHDESLVARGHQVAGLLVGTVTDLYIQSSALHSQKPYPTTFPSLESCGSTHLWHSGLALESPPNSVVDTLRLSP